jgi:L-serine dehydratase
MSQYPSIFNDVIGPVMRGPSSSHCAASLRIARLCRDLMDGQIKNILIEFDPNGSLATTHKSQGSDMGLFGGFLGWEAFDERLPESEKYLDTAGIQYQIEIVALAEKHPNTYQITLHNNTQTHQLIAISTGGGMIEVIQIDGNKVSMAGDYFETLIYCKNPESIIPFLKTSIIYDDIIIKEIQQQDDVTYIKCLHPVLPIKARKNLSVPFISCNEMMEYNKGKNKALWELAVDYESTRGQISADEVMDKMRSIIHIMGSAIETGLKGTQYDDRILGSQSPNFKKSLDANHLLNGDVMNNTIMYVTAIMEVKSSMGVIVAAPTAGSCGGLPGVVFGTAQAPSFKRRCYY